MRTKVRQQLLQLADEDYRKFSSTLIPNVHNMLGIRIPQLRKLAQQIAKEDWRTFLEQAEDEFFEETMLQGMVIGLIKIELEERLQLIAEFIPKINNWSFCDSLVVSLKFTKNNKEPVLEFLQPYFTSDEEYEIRFAVVMLLTYYVEAKYINEILSILDRIKHEAYYVKMAVAWAISICYIKLPEPTMHYLKNNTLDPDTYNKALQKIIESQRIDTETKNLMRSMKRKG